MRLTGYAVKRSEAGKSDLFWNGEDLVPCGLGGPPSFRSRVEVRLEFENATDIYGPEGMSVEDVTETF